LADAALAAMRRVTREVVHGIRIDGYGHDELTEVRGIWVILRRGDCDLEARPSNGKEFNARIFSRAVERVHHELTDPMRNRGPGLRSVVDKIEPEAQSLRNAIVS
jgi:hypothetical protein